MADKAEMLAEAYRRGLLSPEKKAAFEEARKRGLVKRKRGIVEDVTGALANVNSRIPLADEISAAGGVVSGLMTGRHRADDLGGAFKSEMAGVRQSEASFAEDRPRAAALSKGVGDALVVAAPTPKIMAPFVGGSRLGNVARGGVTAASAGAVTAGTDRGSAGQRLQAASEAATNPALLMTGGALGALGPAARSALKPSNARTLKQAGVSLTPGQAMAEVPVVGNLVKNAEDLAQRAPILGPAISGARERGNDSLIKAVGNRSLEPLGETLPTNVKAGHETVKFVKDRLSREYDEAADMVPQVAPDREFNDALLQIDGQLDELGSDVAAQFRAILNNRVKSRLKDGEPITGRQLRRIQSEVGELAARKSASDDVGQQDLGATLEAVSDEMKRLLGRFNPEAGAKIERANQGWTAFVRLRSAASKAPKDGRFTPAGLSTAVRMTDRSVGKGRVAEGEAVLQDLSSAASSVMPDAFGNPGTANAVGLGAGLTGLMTAPGPTMGVAAGLAAAATPYMLMGRQIAQRIPQNASVTQLRQAAAELQELAAKDPKVADLYRQVLARLEVAAGAAGGRETAASVSTR